MSHFHKALDAARQVGVEHAGPHAAAVDKDARFPREAIEALQKARLLGASVPEAFGGLGLTLPELALLCQALGQHCASAAMVFAMHHIQVACIARHAAEVPFFRAYLGEIAEKQLLIASVTSEVGVGGDLRSSIAAIVPQPQTSDGFILEKNATTISYGAYADDLLVTCRSGPDAVAGDQVLVLVRKADYTLERTGVWDTLGMRGTCSPGFKLIARGKTSQILPLGFPDIASRTMVPYSHILWGGTWLGIATDAVARARAYVRGEARKKPGTMPPMALRAAEASTQLHTMRSTVLESAREVAELHAVAGADEVMATVGWALRLNHVKIAASTLVAQIVTDALHICGIAGYRQDTPYSLGRHLRDAHSAALMIGNDRIHATNAAFLCVHKEE